MGATGAGDSDAASAGLTVGAVRLTQLPKVSVSRAAADGFCCTTAMAMSSNWAVDCGLLVTPMPKLGKADGEKLFSVFCTVLLTTGPWLRTLAEPLCDSASTVNDFCIIRLNVSKPSEAPNRTPVRMASLTFWASTDIFVGTDAPEVEPVLVFAGGFIVGPVVGPVIVRPVAGPVVVGGLVVGLVVGTVVGTVVVSVGGLVVGLVVGTVVGTVVGPVFVSVGGFVLGPVFVSVGGLVIEPVDGRAIQVLPVNRTTLLLRATTWPSSVMLPVPESKPTQASPGASDLTPAAERVKPFTPASTTSPLFSLYALTEAVGLRLLIKKRP